jgi:glucokinase
MRVIAAVDIGGHNLRGLLADLEGSELTRALAPTRRDARTAQENVDAVAGLILRMLAEAGRRLEDLASVSVGVPGVVDALAGKIVLVPNVPHWDGLRLGEALQAELGKVSVRMDNDVNLAALGEYWRGSGRGCTSLFFMAIGTGIGGGLVIDGRTYSGAHFSAGEIGYFVLAPGQRERRFGDFGWFESVASGYALDRAGRDLAERSPRTLLRTLVPDPSRVQSRHVFDAAAAGDREAQLLLDEVFEYLAMAVVNITALVDPEVIVIGGGMSSQGERLLAPIRQRSEGYGLTIPPLRISALGEDAQLYGALQAGLVSL